MLLFLLLIYPQDDQAAAFWTKIIEDPAIAPGYNAECVKKEGNDRLTCLYGLLEDKGLIDKYFEKDPKNSKVSVGGISRVKDKSTGKTVALSNPEKKVSRISQEAYDKLMEYLVERMDETLYGVDKNSACLRIPEHSIFYDLYKQRVGKAILEVVTSYCVDKDGGGIKLEDSLKKLAESELKLKENLYKDWNDCLGKMPGNCKDNENRKACIALNDIEELKLALITNEDIINRLNEHAPADGQKFARVEFKNGGCYELYTGAKMANDANAQSSDDLISLSSKDLVDSKFMETYKTELDKFKENCNENNWQDDYCSKFLVADDDAYKEKQKEIDELALRYDLIGRKIGSIESKEELDEFLKTEKRSTELEENYTWNNVRDNIKKKYDAETKAVIEEKLAELEKLDARTKKGENAEKLYENEKDQYEGIEQLLHYHNLVTGLLSVETIKNLTGSEEPDKINPESKPKEERQNTASIFRELKDLKELMISKEKNEDDPNAKKYGSAADIAAITAQIKSMGLKEPDEKEGLLEVSVETINRNISKVEGIKESDEEEK